MTDQLALVVGGRRYLGWTEIRVTRKLTKACSDFDLAVSERWAGQAEPWKILPFVPCQILVGDTPVLTGYVDDYAPVIDEGTHSVRITGRSKTQDLVDCSLDIPSGQFAGYTLAAICISVCALFGIGVVVGSPGAGTVIPNANLQRCEQAWSFLERLCRLCGVLATDDEYGNLVLTDIGATRFAGRLTLPGRIKRASAVLSGRKEFSEYIMKGQMRAAIPAGVITDAANRADPDYTGPSPTSSVQTQIQAIAYDTRVPRYRPHVAIAESQLGQAQMQERVNWAANYAAGQSTKASLTLRGDDVWRQSDGTLWTINQIGPVTVPQLAIDQDLLVVSTTLGLNERDGHHMELEVGPVEGYVPDPAQVKLHKTKGGKGGSGVSWADAGGS